LDFKSARRTLSCINGKKIGAWIAAAIAVAVIGAARFADDVIRTGGDDIVRGSDDIVRGSDDIVRGSDDIVRGGDNVITPFGEGAGSVGGSVDDGAATLEREYGAFSDEAEEAATRIACDTIYTILEQGRGPSSEQWIVIVEGALLDATGVEPTPGSVPWRGLEQIKDATARAIIDPDTGEVDEPTANDLLNDLVCPA
jgi:hypothetical protein